jgi:hypothetical protein
MHDLHGQPARSQNGAEQQGLKDSIDSHGDPSPVVSAECRIQQRYQDVQAL